MEPAHNVPKIENIMNKEIELSTYDAFINDQLYATYIKQNYSSATIQALNDLLDDYNNELPSDLIFYVKKRNV